MMEITGHGEQVLMYPIFRNLCPELSDDEFEGMRIIVCGWLFHLPEVPEA